MAGESQENYSTNQELELFWEDIENTFRYLANLELGVSKEENTNHKTFHQLSIFDKINFEAPQENTYVNGEFKKYSNIEFALKKEKALRLLSEKYKVSEDRIRRSYHEFIARERQRRKLSNGVNHNNLQLSWPTRFSLYSRSFGIGLVNTAAKYAVFAGAVATFYTGIQVINQWAESNRVSREAVLQARRESVQQALVTMKDLQLDDGSLQAKDVIELLAAEGRSLDEVNLDDKSLSLLNLSPNNLRNIKESLIARGRWDWFRDSLSWTAEQIKSPFQNNRSQTDQKPCVPRFRIQGVSHQLRDEVLCVSMERASFRGAQLQSSNFDHASMLDADFNELKQKELDDKTSKKIQKTNLTKSSFVDTDLTRANFNGAVLELANFTDATLSAASFEGANLNWTDFQGIEAEDNAFIEAVKKATIVVEKDGEKKPSDTWRFASYDSDIRENEQMCGKVKFLVRSPFGKRPVLGNKPEIDFDKSTFEQYIKYISINGTEATAEESINEPNNLSLHCFDFRSFSGSNYFSNQEIMFKDANFYKSILVGIDFSNTNLANAILEEADLENVDLTGVTTEMIDLGQLFKAKNNRFVTYSNELRKQFCNAENRSNHSGMQPPFFRKTDFSDVDLDFSCYAFTNDSASGIFEGKTLKGVDFSDSLLSSMSFQNTALLDVKFINANLFKSNFANAKIVGQTQFSNSDLLRSSFVGASFSLKEISQDLFHEANIQYVDFREITFTSDNDASIAKFKELLEKAKQISKDSMPWQFVLFSPQLRTELFCEGSDSKKPYFLFYSSNGKDLKHNPDDTNKESLKSYLMNLIQNQDKVQLNCLDFSQFKQFESNLLGGLSDENFSFNKFDFSKSDFVGVNLSENRFSEVIFSGSNLLGTNFSGSVFSGFVDFSGADLRRTNLGNVQFGEAIFDDKTQWQYANLSGVKFFVERNKLNFLKRASTSEELRLAVYSSNLRSEDELCGKVAFLVHTTADPFSYVEGHLPNITKYEDKYPDSQKVSKSDLVKYINMLREDDKRDLSCFSFERFIDGDFLEGIDLSEFDLSNSDLQRLNLRGANLTNTVLLGANLAGADLTGAKLSRDQITQEQINQTANPGGILFE